MIAKKSCACRSPCSRCSIHLAGLPDEIAQREWRAFGGRMGWPEERLSIVRARDSVGPGNVMCVQLEFEHVTETQTAFGGRNVSGRRMADQLASSVQRHLAGATPVGPHLADQLMLPLALLAGGRYRTEALSEHSRTNAEVIESFLPGAVRFQGSDEEVTVVIAKRGCGPAL